MMEGARVVRRIEQAVGEATNNVAEYLALVYGLQEALRQGYQVVAVKSDSELLVKQVVGEYRVRDPRLRYFHDMIQHLRAGFRTFEIEHIPRTKNTEADRLAGRAAQACANEHL